MSTFLQNPSKYEEVEEAEEEEEDEEDGFKGSDGIYHYAIYQF